MTAAAFAGIVLAGGARQLAASAPMATLAAIGWLVVADAFIVLSVLAVRSLRRWRLPRVPFPKDEHEGTQPMEELDVPDFIREAREQDRAEAADDYLGGLLAEWEADWRKQRGDRND